MPAAYKVNPELRQQIKRDSQLFYPDKLTKKGEPIRLYSNEDLAKKYSAEIEGGITPQGIGLIVNEDKNKLAKAELAFKVKELDAEALEEIKEIIVKNKLKIENIRERLNMRAERLVYAKLFRALRAITGKKLEFESAYYSANTARSLGWLLELIQGRRGKTEINKRVSILTQITNARKPEELEKLKKEKNAVINGSKPERNPFLEFRNDGNNSS